MRGLSLTLLPGSNYNNDDDDNDDDDDDDDDDENNNNKKKKKKNNNNNGRIFRTSFHVKHAQLRWTGANTKIQNTCI